MNKRITFLSVACILLSAVLFACGDDESSNPAVNDDPVSSEEVELSSESSSPSSSAPSSKSSSSEASSGNESGSSATSSKGGENSSSSCSANQVDSSVSSSASSSDSKTSSSSVSGKSSSSGGSNTLARCKTEKTDTCEYGTVVDSRDGVEYKTVKIGDQWWMAENLKFESEFSWCYGNAEANCRKYGRLYSWAAAMDSAGESSTNGWGCGKFGHYCAPTPPVRGACPEGWHLPDSTEFAALFKAIGGSDYAGFKLKSDTVWTGVKEGADSYGFGVLPAGYSLEKGDDVGQGDVSLLWTTSRKALDMVYAVRFGEPSYASFVGTYEQEGNSVRCIKDSVDVSSSSVASSSSGVYLFDDYDGWPVDASKNDFLNPRIKYDSIVDSRDGQVYKTVAIRNQVWMAQNLNYADSVKTPSLLSRNWCYKDNPDNCKVGGRLYNWAAAIDSVKLASDKNNPMVCGDGEMCSLPEKVQGICPEGWHLPNYDEWTALVELLGGKLKAGKILKSKTAWNGRDVFGFSAIPAGGRFIPNPDVVNYLYGGADAFFWSSFSDEEGRAYRMNIFSSDETTHFGPYGKDFGQSIRCIKD